MPTYPTNRWMTTWHFELNRSGTVEEEANFSLHFGGTSYEPEDSSLDDLAEGAYKAWKSNMGTSDWTNAVYLYYCRTYKFNAAGKVTAQGQFADPTPWHGTGTGASLPWETSLALSLYSYERGSFVQNPRRRRGRIYLPPMASSVLDTSNSGYYADSQLDDLLGELHSFMLDAGDSAAGVPLAPPVVFSRVGEALYPISDLYIDAKFDSQRRRERSENAGKLHIPL